MFTKFTKKFPLEFGQIATFFSKNNFKKFLQTIQSYFLKKQHMLQKRTLCVRLLDSWKMCISICYTIFCQAPKPFFILSPFFPQITCHQIISFPGWFILLFQLCVFCSLFSEFSVKKNGKKLCWSWLQTQEDILCASRMTGFVNLYLYLQWYRNLPDVGTRRKCFFFILYFLTYHYSSLQHAFNKNNNSKYIWRWFIIWLNILSRAIFLRFAFNMMR